MNEHEPQSTEHLQPSGGEPVEPRSKAYQLPEGVDPDSEEARQSYGDWVKETNRDLRDGLQAIHEEERIKQLDQVRLAKLKQIERLRREAEALQSQADSMFRRVNQTDYLPGSGRDLVRARELEKEANRKRASANLLEQELAKQDGPN